VLKPWRVEQWVIPPKQDAEFVCRMEEVLDVYERPYDPDRPVVGVDESSKQLIRETRPPVPAAPGHPARTDYEYARNGTANLFMMSEPLLGWRAVAVTDRRTAADFAEVLRYLADDVYADAERVTLVLDNLNTHKPSVLYQAFPPEEARRLARKFEFVYTPKHGSWLNLAELEFGVLQRQCLDRRIGSREDLEREVSAWQDNRNDRVVAVRWQFRTADARVKLRHLYPEIQLR
jgi:hypothetical protein